MNTDTDRLEYLMNCNGYISNHNNSFYMVWRKEDFDGIEIVTQEHNYATPRDAIDAALRMPNRN